PRSMKMGTIASPWRYDAAARHALQSATTCDLAPHILGLPSFAEWSAYPSIAPLSIRSGIDMMGQDLTLVWFLLARLCPRAFSGPEQARRSRKKRQARLPPARAKYSEDRPSSPPREHRPPASPIVASVPWSGPWSA